MIDVSVIISMADNRSLFFERSLWTYAKQTVDKSNFEIIVVDDGDRKDIKQLCRDFSKQNGLQFQYINVDKHKSFVSPKSFTPALTNNIGFKNARGEVVVITGPETLVMESNLEMAKTIKNKRQCWYGLVFLSNLKFVKCLNECHEFKRLDFNQLLSFDGAKNNCHSCPPHPPAYWYWMVANKKDVFNIAGVDERFMGGICGEDDDFSNRMKLSGVLPMFNHKMIGIHQNHSESDLNDNHSVRFTDDWKILRGINLTFVKDNLDNKRVVVNSDHEWGDSKTIIFKEIF